MKVQVRRIEPPGAGTASSPSIEVYEPATAAWMAIEDDPVAETWAPQRADWRLGTVIVLAALIVAYGFLGTADPATDASVSGDGRLTISQPGTGSLVQGSAVEVRGVVTQGLGTVELAVVVGGIALGRTAVGVPGPGRLQVAVPVCKPAAVVDAELVVTAQAATILRRAIRLEPQGPVGIWSAAVRRADGRTVVAVSGCAPLSFRELEVKVTTQGGGLIASTETDVTIGQPSPGSPGPAAVGLGHFEARLELPDPVAPGPLDVEVAWRDPAAAAWGSTWTTVVARVASGMVAS